MNELDTNIRADHPSFCGFLRQILEDEPALTAREIIYIVGKPWKWQGEFELYLLTGKTYRDDED